MVGKLHFIYIFYTSFNEVGLRERIRMEDIIKELYDFIIERQLADKEIMLKEAIDLYRKLDDIDDKNEYYKLYHRLIDIQDLLTSYNNFRDKLKKVKNNIEYDKNH